MIKAPASTPMRKALAAVASMAPQDELKAGITKSLTPKAEEFYVYRISIHDQMWIISTARGRIARMQEFKAANVVADVMAEAANYHAKHFVSTAQLVEALCAARKIADAEIGKAGDARQRLEALHQIRAAIRKVLPKEVNA